MKIGDFCFVHGEDDCRAYEVLKIGTVFGVDCAWINNHAKYTFVECDKLTVANTDYEPSFHGRSTEVV